MYLSMRKQKRNHHYSHEAKQTSDMLEKEGGRIPLSHVDTANVGLFQELVCSHVDTANQMFATNRVGVLSNSKQRATAKNLFLIASTKE